jgi:hypothetical protein
MAAQVHISVQDGQVLLSAGPMRARANKVMMGQKDTVVLEGKVQLHCLKDGMSTEVKAGHIEISLKDGALKIQP